MTNKLADAHLHLFKQGYPRSRDFRPNPNATEIDAYEAFRQAHRIAAGLVVGYEADGIDPQNNAYIRTLAAERPWLATLAYMPAEARPAADAVETLFDEGHTGLAVYLPDGAAASAFNAWPAETWQRLDRRRAIVSLNARPEATRELASTVQEYGGCRFLFSHLGLPGRYANRPSASEAAERIRPLLALADHPNTYVKISGLYAVSDPPQAHPHDTAGAFVELLLDRFGVGRCLWASDFSPALEFVSFAETTIIPWVDRLPAEERAQIMGGNLLAMLGQGDDR